MYTCMSDLKKKNNKNKKKYTCMYSLFGKTPAGLHVDMYGSIMEWTCFRKAMVQFCYLTLMASHFKKYIC